MKSLTIIQRSELNTALKKAVAQRLAFTDYVRQNGWSNFQQAIRKVLKRLGVEVELISALKEATLFLIGFHRGRIKAPVSIVDQLEKSVLCGNGCFRKLVTQSLRDRRSTIAVR